MSLMIKSFNKTSSVMAVVSKSGDRATIGTLRVGALLGNSSSYTFNLNKTSQASLITDIKLDQADAFIPTAIGIFIRKAGSSTTPSEAEQTIAIERTYPNSTIFSGSGEAANLESIYQSGIMAIQLNRVTIVQSMDLLSFRTVGTAQQGVQASQQAAAVGSNGAYLRDAWDGRDTGFSNFSPNICFSGLNTNELIVSLPTAINCAGTSSANYLDIWFRGVAILNGASKYKDNTIDVFKKSAN